MPSDLKQAITDAFSIDGKISPRRLWDRWVKEHQPELYDQIIEATSYMQDAPMSWRVVLVLNDCTEAPKCSMCGGKVKISDGKIHKVCSSKCAGQYNRINPNHTIGTTYSDTKRSEITAKRKRTMRELYGCETNSQRPEVKNILSKSRLNLDTQQLLTEEYLRHAYEVDKLTSVEIGKIVGCDFSTVLHWLREFGIDVRRGVSESSGEREIKAYIESLGFEVESGVTGLLGPDKRELDIFVRSKNFAIEFNGLVWHSSLHKEHDYHYKKSSDAHANGIDLFHVWSFDWYDTRKNAILKSMISSKLGTNKKIGARKCRIVDVDLKIAHQFCHDYHIQGKASATKAYGLECDGVLVSVATFGMPRFTKIKDEYTELIRFCSLPGITVVGGLSRLVRYAFGVHGPIISYCDRMRSFDGRSYAHAGFEMMPPTKNIGFRWVSLKNGTVEYRLKFTKAKIAKLFPNADMTKSQKEIMKEQGYYQLHDCGQLTFIYR